MNVQEVKRRIRLREWAAQINECKQSGLTVKKWCKENGIYVKTYYNRMKKVREELLDPIATGDTAQMQGLAGIGQGLATVPLDLAGRVGSRPPKQVEAPVFAAVPIPRTSGEAATVHIGAHFAEIHNGADTETLERVLRTLAQL
jgi:hypothetical protein